MNRLARIYHPWTEWECFKAGFYETTAPGNLTPEEAQKWYQEFLQDLDWFGQGMSRVMREWPNSCEHFLTNVSMNRIAWLGQSAMCIETGIPSCFRGGFKLLTQEQQDAADALAEQYLNLWVEEQCQRTKKLSNI